MKQTIRKSILLTSGIALTVAFAGLLSRDWVSKEAGQSSTVAEAIPVRPPEEILPEFDRVHGRAEDEMSSDSSPKQTEREHSVVEPWERTLQLLRELACHDPHAALARTKDLLDPKERESALQEIVSLWSQSDPLSAARFVAESIDPGEAQNAAAITVAMRWASVDAQSAAKWIELFPAGELREQALLAVMGSWMTGDTEQLGKWLAGLSDGDLRNTALTALGDNWYNSDPSGALQILDSISEPETREPQVHALLHRWMLADRVRATVWIREHAPTAVHSGGWLAAQLTQGNHHHEENEH